MHFFQNDYLLDYIYRKIFHIVFEMKLHYLSQTKIRLLDSIVCSCFHKTGKSICTLKLFFYYNYQNFYILENLINLISRSWVRMTNNNY